MPRSDHYFIYVRDSEGNFTGNTICVMVRENKVFHGEARCSKQDQFSKKEGRLLAYERALDSYFRYLERLKKNEK